jgi:hypothetical protein
LSDALPIQNYLKRDALLSLFFIFTLEHAIRKAKRNQEGVEFRSTYHILVHADDNSLNENINTIKKNKEVLSETGKEVDPAINVEITKYTFICHH